MPCQSAQNGKEGEEQRVWRMVYDTPLDKYATNSDEVTNKEWTKMQGD